MKKVLFGLLALAIVIGGLGYGWYKSSYGGTERYVKITQDGVKKDEKSVSGERMSLMNTIYLLMIKMVKQKMFPLQQHTTYVKRLILK